MIKKSGLSGTLRRTLLLKVISKPSPSREDVQSVMHSDGRQTKLNYNLAWAKTYLKRVKAIDNSMRGVWSITDIGERMKQEDMEAVPAKVRKQDYNRRRKDSQAKPKTETPPPPSSDDLAEERASEPVS